jgi:hypothetical protein
LDIAGAGYIGWVVWIDGSPIFQSVPHNAKLAQASSSAYVQPVNRADRNTVDWKDLPQAKLSRFELYGLREFYPKQPLFRMDRPPGAPEVRWTCLTMQGIAIGTGGGLFGQTRTGIAGWRVGWFNPALDEFDLWEITRKHRRRMSPAGDYLPNDGPALKGHPCAPRPRGFGLALDVFGKPGIKPPSTLERPVIWPPKTPQEGA